MKKWIRRIVILVLIAGGAVVCAIRWQAWFSMPPEKDWTGDTIQYVFPAQTGEAGLRSDSVSGPTLLVLGDIHNRLTCADYDTLAMRVPQAEAVIQTGDWLERGYEYYRQALLREWTNSHLMGLPVMTCPGNHEYGKGLQKTLSPVWDQLFPHPNNGPVGVPGASYYIDLPQVRIIAMDTNPLEHLVYFTRTLTWLRATMNAAQDRFIVVVMHHPALSAGKGRWNPMVYATFRIALNQADLVLAGHDHSYMRYGHFVVLNTAGKPKPQQTLFTPDASDTTPVYGVLESQIIHQKSQMSFRVYRLDTGEMIDSLYVSHD